MSDVEDGAIQLISRSPSGLPGNGSSFDPAIAPDGARGASMPVFSPDGAWLVFASPNDLRPELGLPAGGIYAWRVADATLRRLQAGRALPARLAFSADGRSVAFDSGERI